MSWLIGFIGFGACGLMALALATSSSLAFVGSIALLVGGSFVVAELSSRKRL
jgi:hypothetical protein